MPSTVTHTSKKSVARHHEFHVSTHPGRIYEVASLAFGGGDTTITLVDPDDITGKALYTAATPGMLDIVEGVAGGDAGKVFNITSFVGDDVVVAGDQTALLAAGDLVAIVPPMASKVTTNGGHTLRVNRAKDETLGLGEPVLTHNTSMQIDPSGTIPFFLAKDSEALSRLLAVGIGAYKKPSAGLHQYVPPQLNDGTYDEIGDFAAYSKDGDDVVNQAFLGLFATQWNLNFPNQGVANGSLQVMGAHALREIGGVGKAFPTGANAWNRPGIERDGGNRHTFVGVVAQFGGSFNDPITLTGRDRYVIECSVTGTRGATDDYVLGSQDRLVPTEDQFGITVTGRRILENDSVYEQFFGTANPSPGEQAETRLHLRAVYPGDATKYLDIDIPKGVWSVDDIQRQPGRFVENFTFRGIQTITGGDFDTANPLYRVQYASGVDVDVVDSL